MTTFDIRKNIKIISWGKNEHLSFFQYEYNGILKALELSIPALSSALFQLASIDDPDKVFNYIISQWDALNIVIHEELINEINKEDGMIAIDNAIKKLKK